MNQFSEIETHCKNLADSRSKLRRLHEAKMKAIREIESAHDAGLRAAQDNCSQIREAIATSLDASRELFGKPKTRKFHGITVGFAKEQDKVIPPADDVLVDRIEKMLPAKQGETLLDRTVAIIKAAFKKLPQETLQKLGCQIVTGADRAVVRADDDDIEDQVAKGLGQAVAK